MYVRIINDTFRIERKVWNIFSTLLHGKSSVPINYDQQQLRDRKGGWGGAYNE